MTKQEIMTDFEAVNVKRYWFKVYKKNGSFDYNTVFAGSILEAMEKIAVWCERNGYVDFKLDD